MRNLLNLILSWYKTDKQKEEVYLSKSKDHADLEFRMRELDRLSINGGRYSKLYSRYYI
jgi:hypothetical protein